MSTIHTNKLISVFGAAALSVGVLSAVAPSAEAAGSSNWVCSYAKSPTSGKNIGKACFVGNLAQVCDLSQDGRTIYGSFAVRGVGPRSFSDTNGSPSPCSYQRFAGTYVTSASATYS